MATRTDTRSPALPGADTHELIRSQGARVNYLKDMSVEIPKRRLTVFTGVSGSGKVSTMRTSGRSPRPSSPEIGRKGGIVKTCGLACHDEVARSVAGRDEGVGAVRNPR
jgi:ABC-type lipoprotein export system ATPase subunit